VAVEALTHELRPPLTPEAALLEADRCLECGGPYAPAPCAVACPAGIDVPRFVAEIAAGKAETAAATIFAENLLGGTCAHVCPVEVLCEGACVLQNEGRRPIQIGALQRHATDEAFARGTVLRSRRPSNGRRVAVIGAGPAGMACAGELAARGYAVAVYDEHDEVGGLVRYAIAPYRQQREPLPAERRVLERLGVEFHLQTPIGDEEKLSEIEAGADAIFLGVGMGADADVHYPGEDLPGVWESLPFIEGLKTGHEPQIGRRVVVIGGGNTAIDVAREAVRMGAADVTMLYRRTRAEMPAYAYEVEEAEAEGIHFQWLATPVRFLGEERLDGIECLMMTLGEPDASGRRRPAPLPGSEFVLPADTAVKAIGQRARPEFALLLAEVDPETGRTADPKVFAGGDDVNHGASVVEAVREGKLAANAIDEWLRCAS
jgi:glutamate synthase (NADPH/NADH) small chain